MATINIFPIKWFGDRNAYMKSLVKIITVGLNPSDKEFREKDGEPYSALQILSVDSPHKSVSQISSCNGTRRTAGHVHP